MVLELAAPASAGPLLQRSIPHIERVFRVRVSCCSAESNCDSANGSNSSNTITVIIQDGNEDDCAKAKVRACCKQFFLFMNISPLACLSS